MKLFEKRKPNLFEKALLIVGVIVIIIGFFMINKLYRSDGMLTWDLLIASFLWLILILMLVLASSSQDIKEELAIIINEIKEEIKLLRNDMTRNKKRKK